MRKREENESRMKIVRGNKEIEIVRKRMKKE